MAASPGQASTAGESSEVLKRRLRTALRRARDESGKKQKEVAAALYWHPSKIIRIEQGVSSVSPSDVRLLLQEYGVKDKEKVNELVELAAASRKTDTWERFRTILKPETVTLVSSERSAELIEKYEPSLIPGLFQTDAYARHLLAAIGAAPKSIDTQIEVRQLRQEMFSAEDRPKIDFIIGEAALCRPVGGSEVMLDQMTRLKELNRLPGVQIRLLPFSAGMFRGLGSPYTILQFADPELPDLVYLEEADRQSIFRDDEEIVSLYLDRFARMSELAMEPDELDSALDKIAAQRFL